ncbi:MAG: exopolyphosphatase / guanosine-5-triphosphate,3-diphosphate pyrophosphatase, partial [Solirubrobacteraceae bacterium]|nr:exopolyphosphatase / guanosine-5-triphosphate,3-diphosphate pyrophosphatase [Solirubrobacteraceae bacterium]
MSEEVRRLAVIDLGSNSFRLVVFSSGEGWWKRTDEIFEAVRIGEGLAATGSLGEAPIRRALSTAYVFAHFCRANGLRPESIRAVATSAIRDAENAGDFLVRAEQRTKLAVRVLSQQEEAYYGYLAAVNSTTLADGCVLDLGGGSMQVVGVEGRLAGASESFRLGAVRMTERFLPDDRPAKRRELDTLRAHVTRKLGRAPWLAGTGRRLVGLGGTVRNLATAAQRAAGLPSIGVQGMVVTRDALEDLVERLAALPPQERAEVPGIKAARADLILAGAVVVAAVLEVGGFDSLEATEAGLREGIFFETHLGGELPLFEDVRRASVVNLAAQYHVDEAHTRHVARLALGLFDELAAAGLHPGDPMERELLWAASALHDIGMSVDYDDHHKHSRYLILNAGLPGFAPNEVAVIAQAALFHRKGMPDAGFLEPVLEEGDLARLHRLAALLRLAEDLERSRDQSVREAHIRVRGDDAELRIIAAGDLAVPRWAAQRETAVFERAFGARLTVTGQEDEAAA